MVKAELGAMDSEVEGGASKPRSTGGSYKPNMARGWTLLPEPPKGNIPANALSGKVECRFLIF